MDEKESPRLQEEYKALEKKEVKEKIEKKEEELKKIKKQYLKYRIRQLIYDLIYSLIIAVLGGFVLWAWLPQHFSILKSLSIGVAWYLLFEELKLHLMFKK